MSTAPGQSGAPAWGAPPTAAPSPFSASPFSAAPSPFASPFGTTPPAPSSHNPVTAATTAPTSTAASTSAFDRVTANHQFQPAHSTSVTSPTTPLSGSTGSNPEDFLLSRIAQLEDKLRSKDALLESAEEKLRARPEPTEVAFGSGQLYTAQDAAALRQELEERRTRESQLQYNLRESDGKLLELKAANKQLMDARRMMSENVDQLLKRLEDVLMEREQVAAELRDLKKARLTAITDENNIPTIVPAGSVKREQPPAPAPGFWGLVMDTVFPEPQVEDVEQPHHTPLSEMHRTTADTSSWPTLSDRMYRSNSSGSSPLGLGSVGSATTGQSSIPMLGTETVAGTSDAHTPPHPPPATEPNTGLLGSPALDGTNTKAQAALESSKRMWGSWSAKLKENVFPEPQP